MAADVALHGSLRSMHIMTALLAVPIASKALKLDLLCLTLSAPPTSRHACAAPPHGHHV